MIKRCQDVGLAQEKKLAGADLKHVRGVQSPKQWCTKKKQKKKIPIITSLKKRETE